MITHFNNETYRENLRWRENNNHTGCIYNTPVLIRSNIPLLIPIFIIEMNNDTNEILAIGLIKNKNKINSKYKIHSDNNYNRYTYKGNKRIEKDQLDFINIEELELLLFKGKNHFKRGQGIINLNETISNKYIPDIINNFKELII